VRPQRRSPRHTNPRRAARLRRILNDPNIAMATADKLDSAPNPARARRDALVVACGALLLGACRAQRTLTITSEPTGSEVRLDGERIGVTPLELEFEHYGQRRVAIYAEGFRTYSRIVDLAPPWYAQFPFDVFTEVLVPVGWRDAHRVHARLQPGVAVLLEPDLSDILARAQHLRRSGPEGPRAGAQAKPKDEK
jgi:hypothetical protein